MSKREVVIGIDRGTNRTVVVEVVKILGGYEVHHKDLRLDTKGCWIAKEISAPGTITWRNEAKALEAARDTLRR